MDTDYFLDTVQWIFVSMEFASMLLFSFVMYGYFKNKKILRKVQSSSHDVSEEGEMPQEENNQ